MKTKRLISAAVIALMLFGTSAVYAQHKGPEHQRDNGLKLTEEQKAKMKDIRTASYKEIKQLENQMGELKAKQRTLTMADKPDMNAINANIDEITKVQNKMMKIRAANHQQIRSLLTDEQKMLFDSKKMRHERQGQMRMHRGGEELSGEAPQHEPSEQS